MYYVINRDSAWCLSKHLSEIYQDGLLIADDGAQVPISSHLLLALSPVIRAIMTDIDPRLYSPQAVSITGVSAKDLAMVSQILSKGWLKGTENNVNEVKSTLLRIGIEDVQLASLQIDDERLPIICHDGQRQDGGGPAKISTQEKELEILVKLENHKSEMPVKIENPIEEMPHVNVVAKAVDSADSSEYFEMDLGDILKTEHDDGQEISAMSKPPKGKKTIQYIRGNRGCDKSSGLSMNCMALRKNGVPPKYFGNKVNEKYSEIQFHHNGIVCDSCNSDEIYGERYECTKCKDFDLCGNCYRKVIHPQHKMKKVPMYMCKVCEFKSPTKNICKICQKLK